MSWLSLRLADMGSCTGFVTRNLPRNGATCYFEQINAIDSRRDHRRPSKRNRWLVTMIELKEGYCQLIHGENRVLR